MNITIKQVDVAKGRRILVTSDIHGHKTVLENLLAKAEFSGQDMLFIIGDILEKGPENLSVLRYVMELAQKDNVVVLIGNVDLLRLEMLKNLSEETCEKFYGFLLRMRSRFGTSIFDEMATELGIRLDSPQKTLASKKALLSGFQEELDFICNLPTIAQTKNYIFVHGGLPSEDLEAVKNRDIYEVLKIDGFMAKGLSFEKYIIVGHWPVHIYDEHILKDNPIINTQQHIISIDGACGLYSGGQLNLLIIPDIDCDVNEITHIFCDDLPVIKALKSQQASSGSINLHFLNGQIRILEEGDEFTYVEHIDTGRRLRVLTRYIYNRKGISAQVRHTDYLLPVNAGDYLSLVEQSSEGYLVKKDGILGWYRGKAERIQVG